MTARTTIKKRCFERTKHKLTFSAFVFCNQSGIISQINSLESASRKHNLPIAFAASIAHPPFKPLLLLVKLLMHNAKILLFSLPGSHHVLLRYNPRDPFMLLTCIVLRRRAHIVFHTYSESELNSSRPIRLIFSFYLNLSLLVSGKIVAVTNELGLLYSRKNTDFVLMPNSIDYSLVKLPTLRTPLGAQPGSSHARPNIHLVFVASRFSPWQGLDVLFESILTTAVDFTLSIVGDHCGEYTEDSRVIYHGNQEHSELESLYAEATLGLSCFALHRKGMKEACPLKVREYLAYGLPVYGSHLDIFPSSFPFFRFGPPCIQSILDFHASMQRYTRQEIRLASREFIDTPIILDRVLMSLV